jgi:hypothetical protein
MTEKQTRVAFVCVALKRIATLCEFEGGLWDDLVQGEGAAA